MFGYIITNPEALDEDRQKRFRTLYCGLCRTLRERHGLAGSVTLSYDLTFLAMLLNALEEPEERQGEERCPAHPFRTHAYAASSVMDYVADMNLALAYHKCLDDWRDDRNAVAAMGAGALKRAYRKVECAWPEKCGAIETWLEEIHRMESAALMEIDPPVNATGRLLGELFSGPEPGTFSQLLRDVGDGLGRFVYFMDAYEDLPQDVRRGRYNPLKPLRDREDYEELCRSALTMMIADATDAFERLPIVKDADILRNVLYSGVWSKYMRLQARKKGAK